VEPDPFTCPLNGQRIR